VVASTTTRVRPSPATNASVDTPVETALYVVHDPSNRGLDYIPTRSSGRSLDVIDRWCWCCSAWMLKQPTDLTAPTPPRQGSLQAVLVTWRRAVPQLYEGGNSTRLPALVSASPHSEEIPRDIHLPEGPSPATVILVGHLGSYHCFNTVSLTGERLSGESQTSVLVMSFLTLDRT